MFNIRTFILRHRAWIPIGTRSFVILFVLYVLLVLAMGIYALRHSPYSGITYLATPHGIVVESRDTEMASDGLEIIPGDTLVQVSGYSFSGDELLRYPEFVFPRQEQAWWDKHQALYAACSATSSVPFVFRRPDGALRTVNVPLTQRSYRSVLGSAGFVCLSIFVLICVAFILVFRDVKLINFIGALPCLSLALYYAALIPLAGRELTLDPALFKFLVKNAYAAMGGAIILLHLAMLFPTEDARTRFYRPIVFIIYAHLVLSVGLYFSGIIAYGSTFFMVIFWSTLMVFVAVQGYRNEVDPLPRRNMLVFCMALAFMALLTAYIMVLPVVLRQPPVPLSIAVLFSMLLPPSIILGIENKALYAAIMQAERNLAMERVHIARNLHDDMGNDLSYLRHYLKNPSPADAAAARLVISKCIDRVRDFIWTIDPHEDSWTGLADHFLLTGQRICDLASIELVMHSEITYPDWPLDSRTRFHLVSIFKEAITNALKYSQAKSIMARIRVTRDEMSLVVQDNGIGFVPPATSGGRISRGLTNMKQHAQEIHAVLTIDSRPQKGVRIELVARARP